MCPQNKLNRSGFEDVVCLDPKERKKVDKVLALVEKIKKYLDETHATKRKNEKQFLRRFHSFLVRLNDQSSLISDTSTKIQIKKVFRKQIEKYISMSPLCHHGYIKPKGYPGDYKIVEAMYDNQPIATANTMGFLFDQFLLQAEYVQAVRDRKNAMKEALKKFITSKGSKKLKILNIACGSAREIRELLSEGFSTDKEIEFVLLDQDKECLDYAKQCLSNCASNFRFFFVQSNVYSFFRNKEFNRKFTEFNFVYSIGLADYLPDLVLEDMIHESFARLTEDGKLTIAHKNVREFDSVRSDWICDWNFIPRDKRDIQCLIHRCHINKFGICFRYLKTQLIFFFTLQKI